MPVRRKRKKKSGGLWGDVFRTRLGVLIQATPSGTQAGFARLCGTTPPQVSNWRSGNLPRLDRVREIAVGTGVSLDWLAGAVGNDSVIVYRDQTRSANTLAQDAAAYASRRLSPELRSFIGIGEMDSDAVLDAFGPALQKGVLDWQQWRDGIREFAANAAGDFLVTNAILGKRGEKPSDLAGRALTIADQALATFFSPDSPRVPRPGMFRLRKLQLRDDEEAKLEIPVSFPLKAKAQETFILWFVDLLGLNLEMRRSRPKNWNAVHDRAREVVSERSRR